MDTPLDMLQIKIDRAREALPRATRNAIDSVKWRDVILGMREKKGYSFEQLEDLELETELLLCGLLEPVDYPKRLEEEMKIPRAQVDLLVAEMNQFVFEKIKNELIKNTEREEVFKRKEEPTNEQLRITNLNTKNSPLPNLPLNKGEEKGGGLVSNVVEIDKHIVSPNIIRAEITKPIPNIPIAMVEGKGEKLSNETTLEIMPKEINAPTIVKIEPKIEEKKESTFVNNIPIINALNKTIDEKPTESIFSQKLSGSFQMPTIKTEYSLPSVGKDKTNINSQSKIRNSTDPYREIPD
jgi:hypothetical protein